MHVKSINIKNSSFHYSKCQEIETVYIGHLFAKAVKIMLFISDAQYYIPVKLCRTASSIHLFKITRKLIPEHVKLKKNIMGCHRNRLERSQYDFKWK